jgi:hypothetical protein
MGYAVKSAIVWTTKPATSKYLAVFSLSGEQEPSPDQKTVYKSYLQYAEWDEEKAKLEMK